MRRLVVLLTLILVVAGLATAQPPIETPTGDSSLRDDNIRQRSIELERTRKDLKKNRSGKGDSKVTMKSDLDKRFPEINEDFNGMQFSYQEIVKAYENSSKTDYKAMETSSKAMKKHAKRLNSNLFDSSLKPKKDKKKEDLSIKDLIIKLDKALVSFTRSEMFKNLRVVEPKVAEKAQMDLFEVMKISDKLAKKSKKMK